MKEDAFRAPSGAARQGTPQDFAARLSRAMDDRIKIGNQGIDMRTTTASGQRLGPEELAYRKFFMTPEVFQLGVDIQRKVGHLDPRTWASWMGETIYRETSDKVLIFQESAFKNEYTKRFLGSVIENHFAGKRVEWRVDSGIKESVGR